MHWEGDSWAGRRVREMQKAGRRAGPGDSPVDEVVFLQVLAAAGDVPGHVQEVQHGQGGGLVLWETETGRW